MQEQLSVIIPTYNCARYLGAALDSVAAQTHRPLEVIVIDDGSTDETPALVDAFFYRTDLPGQYRYQPNQGPAAARNHGFALASGAWIAFLDADDVWIPGKSECQLQVLAEYPDAGVAWGDAIVFEGDEAPDTRFAAGRPDGVPTYLLQSMLFRREVFERVGPLDPELRLGEDVDWLLRALEQNIQIVVHRDAVVYYRRHTTNLTSDADLTQRTFHMMLKMSLERRRRPSAPSGARPLSLIVLPPKPGSALIRATSQSK